MQGLDMSAFDACESSVCLQWTTLRFLPVSPYNFSGNKLERSSWDSKFWDDVHFKTTKS